MLLILSNYHQYPLTQFANLVEDRNRQTKGKEVVAPDPLILNVVLQWELSDFGRKGVREFHGVANGLFNNFVSHFLDLLQVWKMESKHNLTIFTQLFYSKIM